MLHYSVYVTAPDHAAAIALARILVGERLAACANVIDGATSVFWWEGAVQEQAETAMILKTTEARLPSLLARIKAIHPYSVPCAVAWPIVAGAPDYLAWVSAETGA